LPRRLAYRTATAKGMMDARYDATFVSEASRGLGSVFPDWSEGRRIAVAQSLKRQLAREVMDVFWLGRLNAGNVSRFIRLEGVEALLELRSRGRPAILFSGHFGRLIMPAMALGAQGISTSCLMADVAGTGLPEPEKRFLRFKIRGMQRLMGGQMISKADPYRRLYRALAGGGMLILIVDAPPAHGDRVDWVPFLGGRLLTASGILRLARKTGAALVPYFAVEEADGLVGRFLPEREIANVSDREALARIFAPLDEYVRRYPDHWWLWNAVPSLWRAAG
jgi:KDO2-lipid IV(A) lauroyltransferase